MQNKIFARNPVLAMIAIIIALSGCAGLNKNAPKVEAGGYTWYIVTKSEGSIRMQANGLPGQQAAVEAATIVCKEYGRVAQFVKSTPMLMAGVTQYDFNCVR